MLVVERVDDAPEVSDRRRGFVHRVRVDGVPSEVLDVDRLFGAADERSQLGGTEEPQPAWVDDLVQARDKGRALRAQLGVETEVRHERCDRQSRSKEPARTDVAEASLARDGDVAAAWDEIARYGLAEL